MSADPITLTADSLLRHETFVRSVVRGILGDGEDVHDVVQETWVRALVHPPTSARALRAWLGRVSGNLARDAHRRGDSRAARERLAARPEVIESVDTTHDRLSAYREVVGAVLELRDPYRTVVLMHYFQELGIAEIAGRTAASAGTVRSRLSRAHTILRDALDARFGGDRGWALALAGAMRPETAGSTALLKLVGAAGLVLGIAWSANALVASRSSSNTGVELAQSRSGELGVLAAGRFGSGSTERVAIDARAADQDPAASGDIDSLSLEALLELAVQTQRVIGKRILTPDPVFAEENRELLALPGTGIARLLRTDHLGVYPEHLVLKRGGGAYFSFATLDHSYNSEPDLSFRDGYFSSGFYGSTVGLLVPIGHRDLAELPTTPFSAPVPESYAAAWDFLWEEYGPDFKSRAPRGRSVTPTQAGETFLLRRIDDDEHDHLVAFRVLALDPAGCTILWRILRKWPVDKYAGNPSMAEEFRHVPAGPSWLEERSLDELLALLAAIRARGERELLGVPEETKERYFAVTDTPQKSFAQRSGFARLLHRGRWTPLLDKIDRGSYFDFQGESNDWGSRVAISLERGYQSNGGGLFLDLGEIPFEELRDVMDGTRPGHLDAREREAWDFLWSARARLDERGRRSLTPEDSERVEALRLKNRAPAVPGHTYLLRALTFHEFDYLVVFTVAEANQYGHTLAWRLLKSWAVEQR